MLQVPAHGRARICLLKGCEKRFSPAHPFSRYCSAACVDAARRWSRRQAAQRYRASERGKELRRRQSCRYRERVRQRQEAAPSPPAAGEGHQEAAEETMARSLRRYGQISPVVVCLREETPVLVDGFKRLAAARVLKGMESLSARRIDADERGAKAAMYALNRTGRHLGELEEAWLVQALVREDGLSQAEVAVLLGRHKSWVCRRLAMMEKLCPGAQDDLRLGLLSPTMARQLVRLPAGNQPGALETKQRHSLSAAELRGVVDLLLASGTEEKAAFVLEQPRQALHEVRVGPVCGWDPRLSTAGNRVSRHLGMLLDQLARMANWIRHRGRGDLALCDRGMLEPAFTRLAGEAQMVAELTDDFLKEIHLP